MCHRCALALTGLGALALAVTRAAGTRTASEALSAMVITVAVAVPLVLASVLALVIMRVRRERLTYRPDPGIARARVVRVEIVATHRTPAEGTVRPVGMLGGPDQLALPAASPDCSPLLSGGSARSPEGT